MHAVKDNLGKRAARKRKTSAIRGPCRGHHLGAVHLARGHLGPEPLALPCPAGGEEQGRARPPSPLRPPVVLSIEAVRARPVSPVCLGLPPQLNSTLPVLPWTKAALLNFTLP